MYRTLVDFPGVPAGEVMVYDDTTNPDNPCYRGQTHIDFWMSRDVVENTPSQFEVV